MPIKCGLFGPVTQPSSSRRSTVACVTAASPQKKTEERRLCLTVYNWSITQIKDFIPLSVIWAGLTSEIQNGGRREEVSSRY